MFQVKEELQSLVDRGGIVENLEDIDFMYGVNVSSGIKKLISAYKVKCVDLLVDVGTLKYNVELKELMKTHAELWVADRKKEGAKDEHLQTYIDQMQEQALQIENMLEMEEKKKADFMYYQNVLVGLGRLLKKHRLQKIKLYFLHIRGWVTRTNNS